MLTRNCLSVYFWTIVSTLKAIRDLLEEVEDVIKCGS